MSKVSKILPNNAKTFEISYLYPRSDSFIRNKCSYLKPEDFLYLLKGIVITPLQLSFVFMFFVCVKQLLRYSHGVLIREYILLYKRKCEGQIGNYCRVPYQGTKWHILHRTVGTFKLSCALFICIQNRYFWNVIFLMYYLPFFMKQTSRMVVLHEMSLSYPPIMDDNTRNGENV